MEAIDINFYQKNGYYLYMQQLFAHEKLNRLLLIFEEMENKGLKSGEFDTPHFNDNRLLEFLLSEEVLQLVESAIGPNIGLWSSHFISKEPFTGKRTPWHEDSAYWNGRFDILDKMVTIWLALDNSTLENGCMGVVPGSHTNGYSDYLMVDTSTNIFSEEINPTHIDISKVKWLELNKGECSLHDARIIHGANANTSPYRRCGYTMRYFNLEMKLNIEHPNNKNHKIYWCKGENIGQNPLIYFNKT